jgi:hypothetical protein
MEIDTAAGDEFTGNTYLVFEGFTLHLNHHQGVVGFVVDVKGLSPRNAELVSSFSFHILLLT